ncbi:hypothetical protein [Halorubrum distributum]|uniref:DUF1102 domain-containing protein n=1 Tax=Halorubrum distributum TaxID=29283 RepID=A0A6B1IQF4_9EURY|nr:hypothetical protein [Halorubrum terrestre]MYL68634.1 hypothetical protein [Halorubrum terrestre]
MTNRRKFLIGLGAATAGSAAAFGTAASTTFNLNDRNVGANITTDSSGAVAFTDNSDGDIINQTNGEIEIDFAEGAGSGVNVGSTVTLGSDSFFYGTPIPSPKNNAFAITNQTTAPIELEIEFEAGEDFTANANGSEMIIGIDDGKGNGWADPEGVKPINVDSSLSSGDTVSVSYDPSEGTAPKKMPSGESVYAAILVDADNDGSSTEENLSGVLNITATSGGLD